MRMVSLEALLSCLKLDSDEVEVIFSEADLYYERSGDRFNVRLDDQHYASNLLVMTDNRLRSEPQSVLF